VAGLLLVAIPVLAPAAGGPRDAFMPVVASEPLAEPMDRNAWMAKLAGRFSFDGSIHHEEEIIDFNPTRDADPDAWLGEWSEPAQGKADCIQFAEGPGIQCVMHVEWLEHASFKGTFPMGGASDLTPGVVLAGFTPTTAPDQVRILLGDSRGLAHPGSLKIRGNSLVGEFPCVNLPGSMVCTRTLTITSRADSRLVFVNLFIERRFNRNKLDRKLYLGTIGPKDSGRVERSTEYAEERLSVAFSLRPDADTLAREPQPHEAEADTTRH
jgi:hypothetical protein